MTENAFSLLGAHVAAPDKTFIETLDGRVLRYRDMRTISARYAGALATLGVEPGDRVAVQVEKSPEALMLYLACLRVGAAFLPLNTGYTDGEIAYFLGDAEPRLAVCDPGARDGFSEIAANAGVPCLETLDMDGSGTLAERADAESDSFADIARSGDDLAAILYTSGTTGRSKGAMLTHANLASNAAALAEYWRFTADDMLLHALPIFHTHGLFVATNVVLYSGCAMLFLPRFDAAAVIAALPRTTAMMGVPTFYSRLLSDQRFSRDAAAHMRLFVSGSAPLSPEVHKAFQVRTGHAILERYGMTETGMNSSNPYDDDRLPGTVGFPLPGVEIRIADQQSGQPRPVGEVGVIEISGPNVFKGYWRMPEKTAEAFRPDGYFISGDLGRFDEDGYLHIVGRDKDLIISGGFNVYPAEVEAALDAQDGIAESAVIGLPHADFGEAVTAIVIPRPGQKIAEDGIRQALATVLAKYKIPKRIISLESLPRNAMGKVQKNELRKAHEGIYR